MKNIEDYDFTRFDPDKKYHLHIDADTLLFSCAVVIDNDPCAVKHHKSGRKKTFESFSDFVHFLENDDKGKKFTVKDFDVPVIGFAFSNFNGSLKRLVDQNWIEDYTIYLGGATNFRKDLYPQYKANRKKSPAMRKFLFDYVCWKYKEKVKVSVNEEAEDFCLAQALNDPIGCIGFVDKDLCTQSGLFYNYQKPDLGVFHINKEQAFYNLCCQLLHGDSTDHIFGITRITEELKQKYGIKTKSIGAKTAEKLLEDVKHCKLLMKERMVDVYKLSYGDEWKDKLQFIGSLVFISKVHGEYFDINKFTKGVSCET